MMYKEQLKGKKLEIKSAKIGCLDGELINNNDIIAPIYSINPVPTISVLDTIHNTVQEELRKEWRREMNKMLWKMGVKNR